VDRDVDEVIAGELVSADVVVEREAQVGHRSRRGALDRGVPELAPAELRDPDVAVGADVLAVVEDEGDAQRVRVDRGTEHT